MKRFFVFAALTIISSVLFASKFTITPPKQELVLKPGENKTISITVDNMDDSILHLKIYPTDWLVNSDNEISHFPASSLKNSCSGWFYINPQEFNINGKTSQEVRISVQTPTEVFGDYWSMLYFESTPYMPDENSMILLNTRIGSAIYVTIAGTTTKNGDIIGLDFDKKENKVKAVFENTGNVHVRVKGFLQIFKEDKMVYEKTVDEKLSLPESKTNIYFPVETELQKGEYLIKVNLDYSGSENLEGEKRITIN